MRWTRHPEENTNCVKLPEW